MKGKKGKKGKKDDERGLSIWRVGEENSLRDSTMR